MYIIELLLIQMIVVFIVDLSGITTTIKHLLSRILTKGKVISDNYTLPLFGCSLCMTFWMGLLYLLFVDNITIPYIAWVCLLSLLTSFTKDLLIVLRDVLIKLINKLC